MKNARQAWDNEQIARAVGFTTSRFLGRGQYDTRRFGDQASALADAAGDRRAIVYAITPEGFTIHITNGDQIAPETIMTTTNPTFSSKSNTIRAARKDLGPDAVPGADFHLVAKGDRWFWSAGAAPSDLDAALVAHRPDGAVLNALAALPMPGAIKETREEKRLRKIAEADARNAAKGSEPAATKAPRAPKAKAAGQRAELLAAAERGEMPTPPDFSADTHKRFRKTLEQLVDLAGRGDVKGLKAVEINPISSSRQAMNRYRNLAVVALEAQRRQPKAA